MLNNFMAVHVSRPPASCSLRAGGAPKKSRGEKNGRAYRPLDRPLRRQPSSRAMKTPPGDGRARKKAGGNKKKGAWLALTDRTPNLGW